MKNITYTVLGILFGIVLLKSQVVSWYRIQEMFLFDSFHMYGVISVAIITSAIGLFLIKKYQNKSSALEKIEPAQKPIQKGIIPGGILFGLGWSLIGACPGPIYALIGNGATIYILAFISAMLGVAVYGFTLGKKEV